MPRSNRTTGRYTLSIRESLPARLRVSVEQAEDAINAAQKTAAKVYAETRSARSLARHGIRSRRVNVRTVERLERETTAALIAAYQTINSLSIALVVAEEGRK